MKSEFYIPESALRSNETSRTVTVEVIFGMPAKDCLYHGICKIEPVSAPTKDVNGLFKLNTPTMASVLATASGQLVFRFYKSTMMRGKANRHFGSGYFIILEDIMTPAWMNKLLEISEYNIRKGIYMVNEEAAWYEVVFT